VHNPRYETENTNIKLRYERDEEQIEDNGIEVADNHVDGDGEHNSDEQQESDSDGSVTSSVRVMREIQDRSTTNKSARRGSSGFLACCCGT